MRSRVIAAICAASAASVVQAITIPTVPIGNPGNAPDPFTGNLYGSVSYTYNIGQTEVTNAQYAAFLNAVAATDTNSLYDANMAGSSGGGINRAGPEGSYVYSTVAGRENHPVSWITFWDTTRFANWLHNGQPTGPQNASTTEDGAYTLTPSGISANTITRNAGWQWAVPSENEWYKAAYHQPASQGGDVDGFWAYPNSANTLQDGQANAYGWVGEFTNVGAYAANYYGVFDLAGNAAEWTESFGVFGTPDDAAFRVTRGSGWQSPSGFDENLSDFRIGVPADLVDPGLLFLQGFRVVQIPGPGSVALLGLGGLIAARRRRS